MLEKRILKFIHLKSENLSQTNVSNPLIEKNYSKWSFVPPKKQILKLPYKNMHTPWKS